MAEQYNRAFKGVWISKDIWLAKDLGWTEKLVLVEIDSLDGEQGCWASNDYLAAFFGLSKGRISKVISALKEKGYITVEMLYKPGTKEIQKRTIRVDREVWSKTSIPPSRKQPEGMVENVYTPIVENSQENNTSINNTTNNTKNKRKKEGDKPLPPPSPLIDQDLLKIKNHFETHVIYQEAAYAQTKALSDFMDDGYNTDLIIKAMDIAVQRNKPHLPYINGILKQWRLDGITNIQQVIAKEAPHHGSNQQPNASHIGKTPEEIAMLERLRTYSSNPNK